MMIERLAYSQLVSAMATTPVVILLGPVAAGKTTLARAVMDGRNPQYFDLSQPVVRDHMLGLGQGAFAPGQLMVLDGCHHMPGLMPMVQHAAGQGGRFVLVAPYAVDGMDFLTGLAQVVEISGLTLAEVGGDNLTQLWSRGGLPGSFAAVNDPLSLLYRQNHLSDITDHQFAKLGAKGAGDRVRKLLALIAAGQGAVTALRPMAQTLGVDEKTVAADVAVLEDLNILRRLTPLNLQTGKRLVKRPKLFLRDSGLVHALGVGQGASSWAGFVTEQVLTHLPPGAEAGFYKTSAAAEAPLVVVRGGHVWAMKPDVTGGTGGGRGFTNACNDLGANGRWVVGPDNLEAVLANVAAI